MGARIEPRPAAKQDIDANAPAIGVQPDSLAMRAAPFALLAVIAVAAQGRLLFSPSQQVIGGVDVRNYLLWANEYTAARLRAGEVPLWNPHIFAGVPHVANPQMMVFYPPAWLSMVIPPAQAHKWIIALHVFAAGAFMFMFLRAVGLTRPASLAGAVTWMLGHNLAYRVSLGHLSFLTTAAWLPLAMLLHERWLESPSWRRAVWLGAVLGVQVLSGGDQNCYYTLLLLAGYGLTRTVLAVPPGRGRWEPARFARWFGGLSLAVATAAAVSAVQLIPTLELASQCDRRAATFDFAAWMSLPPASLLGLIVPGRQSLGGLNVAEATINLNWEYACYVSIAALVLAGASLAVRRQAALAAARVMFLVGMVLALGANTPIYEYLYHGLPGLKMFRVPARALVIVVWSLSVMAAFGTDWALASADRWRRGRWRIGTIAAILAVSAAIVSVIVTVEVRKFSSADRLGLADPDVMRPLAMLGGVAVAVFALRYVRSRTLAAALLVVLVAGDLLVSRQRFDLVSRAELENKARAVFDSARSKVMRNEPYRLNLPAEMVAPDVSMAVGVENVNGYWPVMLDRFARYAYAAANTGQHLQHRNKLHYWVYEVGRPIPRLLNTLVVGRLSAVPGTGTDRNDPDPDLLIEGFEVSQDFIPRAWLVGGAEVVPGDKAALERVADVDFHPLRVAVFETPPRLTLPESADPIDSDVTVTAVPGGGLDIDLDAPTDCYLVLSEVWYPGWKAFVDGAETPVERADYALSAVAVPAGKHRIAYRYDPWTFKLGAIATVIAMACLSLLAFVPRCRVSRNGKP